MGSGKGQTKRVQARHIIEKVESDGVTCDPAKWEEFVQDNGRGSIKLFQYYLGSGTDQPTAEEYEKLFSELLADAVTVGAIAFPDPYKPEDFQIIVTQN